MTTLQGIIHSSGVVSTHTPVVQHQEQFGAQYFAQGHFDLWTTSLADIDKWVKLNPSQVPHKQQQVYTGQQLPKHPGCCHQCVGLGNYGM